MAKPTARVIRNALHRLQSASSNGNGFAFVAPNREEYENYLRKQKFIPPNGRIEDHPKFANYVYRDWQTRSQIACEFARIIATNPKKYGLATSVLPLSDIGVDAHQWSKDTDQFVSDQTEISEGVSIIIPGLTHPADLVEFCKYFRRLPKWSVSNTINPSDRLDRVYVNLSVKLDKNTEAEVLGFGPFDFLPLTRQSPITAIEVRTKIAGAKERADEELKKSHLADIAWPEINRDQLWSRTKQQRLKVLGGDDSAARARITFAIPATIWSSIGANGGD